MGEELEVVGVFGDEGDAGDVGLGGSNIKPTIALVTAVWI